MKEESLLLAYFNETNKEKNKDFNTSAVNHDKKASLLLGLFTAGALSGYLVEELLDDNLDLNRYPIQKEYTIIDNCINAYREPVSESLLRVKRDTCICALHETELGYSYKDFENNQEDFLDIFERKIEECR